MGRSHSKREGKEKNAELSKCSSNEGTAARTRPYSYGEIMLNRKNKKLSENAELDKKVTEMGTATRDITTKNASNANTTERHEKSSTSGPEKYSYDEVGWRSLRVKEDNLTVRVNSPAIRNDKELRAPEKRLKSEITKAATENDECRREEQLHSRKRSGRPSNDFRDIDAKRQSRDLVEKDWRIDRVQGRSDRDSQKKHHIGEADHRSKERNGTKNYDIRRGQGAETIGRKERIKSHLEEQRHKQIGSCSRELEENQHIRSDLVLQQGHKHTSHTAHEHGSTSHNSKGRPVKHHSDVDEKKIKSNGSSSHHKQQSGSTSGLGGYSPRKRKTEAAGRIPSPSQRSPGKRAAKWDMAPAGTEKAALVAVSSNIQTSTQAATIASAVSSVSATVKSLTFAPPSSFSNKKDVPVDSVQLTEATRPMRRLYIENLPASATEKTIMEYLNHLLLSSGASYIPGSKPCISCTIHREKGQALVEFLTPEDTKAALLLDGSTFSGSIVKIRRPRDFIEVVTGELEKSEVASTVISNTVEDSPHKIFLGGISTALSSEMLMEIASAFGPLKAFHFESNKNLNEPCAFLEFADHSVTGKACAGLNGMKLGGQIITAVQAVRDSSMAADDIGSQAFFNIPKLARPLLEKATEVLKLKNLFDPEAFSSLSEPEVEEILEDVRLECSRFGSVKSMNVVKYTDVVGTATETCKVNGEGVEYNRLSKEKVLIKDLTEPAVGEKSGGVRSTELVHLSEGKKGYEKIVEGDSNNEENSPGCLAHQVHQAEAIGSIKDIPNWTEEDPRECLEYHNNEAVEAPKASSMPVVSQACGSVIISSPMEISNKINSSDDVYCSRDDQAGHTVHPLVERSPADDSDGVENERKLQEASAGTVDGGKRKESDAEERESNKGSRLMQRIFEPGCVFVEFRRTEASCMAAHCLHGQLFDDQVVTVEYVDVDLYHRQFTK